jgi:hypothetical protein
VEQEEFFADVKDEMADIIELAAKHGRTITPRQAYEKAVSLHPEVSKVVEQRRAFANQTGSTQKAMAAASSVKSSPASGIGSDQPKGLRDEIAAAWNAVAERSR